MADPAVRTGGLQAVDRRRRADAGELERVDPCDGARDEPRAGELDRDQRDGAEPGRAVELAADWPPQPAHDNQQHARNPDIHRAQHRLRNGSRQPGLHAIPREHAVMRREHGEQQRISRDDRKPRSRAGWPPDDEVVLRADVERRDKHRAAEPDKCASRHLGGYYSVMLHAGGSRIVISGIGVVSPFGVGRERFWDHVSRGVSGTKAITQFDVSTYPCQVAAWVPPVSIDDALSLEGDADHDGRADPRRYSRAALFGVVAAREAWHEAGLRAGEPGAGVLIGSGGGGIDIGEKQYEDFFTSAGRHVTPYAIAIGICGMVSSEISISLGLRGLSHVLSCGCTSSTDAIGYAASLIRSGEYEVVLSGGTDGCVLPGMIFGFSRMRAVSTRYNDRPAAASRPFDRGRDGFVLGEGAWMFVLESEERALARGVRPYARIEGYG